MRTNVDKTASEFYQSLRDTGLLEEADRMRDFYKLKRYKVINNDILKPLYILSEEKFFEDEEAHLIK